tara:strand:+ start:15351 stop:19274 length:3924 start_codon:yes stop_codon:yes gene_type:complete
MKSILTYTYILSFVLALFCAKETLSQQNEVVQKQVSFRELTVKQGLSQNSVVSIAQDSTGFMWFATQDGLNKYNGKKFTHYDRQFEDITRPTFSKLGKIYVDKEGKLWIVSNTGVLEVYHEEEDSFKVALDIKSASVFFQDSKKEYYLGTYGNGFYKINPTTKDTIQLLKKEDLSLNSYDIIEWQGTILASTSKGLLQIKDGNYGFLENELFQNTTLSALSKYEETTLFTGSYGKGLFIKKAKEKAFSHFSGFENYPFPIDLNIQDLLLDNQQRLWVATYGNGAYLIDFEKKYIQNFTANKTDPYALHYNDVLCLYKDFTQTVWLGTDGAGLSFYDENLVKFNVLTNNQTPPNIHVDVIRSIVVSDNTIWMGTSGKGLTKASLSGKKFKTFTQENSNLAGDRVMSLYMDNGNLLIGHQNNGLQTLYEDDTITSCKGTENLTIWKILKRDKTTFWLCTRNQGLVVYDKTEGVVKKFDVTNSSLQTNNIRTVAQGDNNTLWIGTENDGLYRLNISKDSITKIKSIPDNIKCLYYSKNLLWVGTNGNGLKLYNIAEKNIQTYTKKDGLPNNVVYGILPDGQNNLWLSTNQGLTKISTDANYRSTIENYSNYDGLQALEYNTGAYFKDEKGTLYFGGLEGINWFQPSQLTFNPKKPKTVITGLEVFNEEKKMVPNQKLPYNKNTLTFNFSSLHYSQPERNQYKYKLVNNDKDWIASGNNNTAHYTNLPPEDYTFQVISSNYDGVWNNTPASYSFTILKPWYASTMAIIIYIICVLLLMYGLYAYLKWRWNVKNQLRLEHEETERLKKLDEFKTKLYTNISHEIRTPLTLISGPVENQLKKQKLRPEDKKDLDLIQQNSNRLMRLVNQMLDLSLIDSGEVKLTVKKANLSILLHQITAAFQYTARSKEKSIENNIQEIKEAWFDTDVIEKTVSNLLSNAVKYAPTNTNIQFKAFEKEGNVSLSVSNVKSDSKKTDLKQLFERFHQNDSSSEGMGVGLALVKELVVLHRGTISASENDVNEITFCVTLPITKDAFMESEIYKKDKNSTETKATQCKTLKKDTPTYSVLVVEDNLEIQDYIASNLNEAYTVFTAENGKKGINKAKKELPHLIISDIMMPLTNGIELCNTLKSDELTSHIPIILLTAKVGEENEIEGFKTGADAYITKPFSIKKLRVRVKKLIESRQKLKEHFGKTFELNPELAITSTETNFLNRMQEVLDKHITNPELTSEEFSRLMHMSRTQLHRKLTSIVGMNTTTFIRLQRLKLACPLLKEADSSTSEIAYQVGFNSPSYFTRCFKEVYGCTPTEYMLKQT